MYTRSALPALFKDFFDDDCLSPAWMAEGRSFAPAVDVYEKDGELKLDVDLPGVTKKEISVEYNDGVLTIKGQRNHEAEEKTEKQFTKERFYGAFARAFRIGDGYDHQKIAAKFEDGVLKVTMPRREETKPVSVRIQ